MSGPRSKLPLWLLAFFALNLLPGVEALGATARFRRGDSNVDTRFDISDAIQTLGFLFLGQPTTLGCADAADANDDGRIDLSDAIYSLGFLFLGGIPLPSPFPDCGIDPTVDSLDCQRYEDCVLFSITIESPPNLFLTNAASVDVSGKVEATATLVKINDVSAVIQGDTYQASAVPLVEGVNRLSALASDGKAKLATANVQVVRDTTPPRVVITSPANNAVVFSATMNVTGAINDTIAGFINESPPRCEVAGTEVPVVNKAFSATGVALTPGVNTIVATVTDRAGNMGTASVQVTFDDSAVKKIEAFSGDLQSAQIGQRLPAFLVARLLDPSGQPVPNKPVVFRVKQSNGQFSDGTRLLLVNTNAQGKAAAAFSVGTRTGEGCNRVEATAAGFSGKAVFASTSLGGPPAKINVSMGAVQKGAIDSLLPDPLGALVTDSGGNCVSNLPVVFRATAGGGHFEANGLSTLTLTTDVAGRVAPIFVLGPEPGVENNVVEASFEGMKGLPASFVASAFAQGDPANTTISGLVLDNVGAPLHNVVLMVLNTDNFVQTSSEGQFHLTSAPVGPIRLLAVGRTTTRPGSWPTLEYDMVTIAGVDNSLTMPIHLLPLADEAQAPLAGGDEDVVLTLPDVPRFRLRIFPHSTKFAGEARPGKVTVTQVHSDRIPMAPADGLQPTLILTIQPPNVAFDPPAQIAYPNSEGLTPGEITEMYSFDHDLGRFVSTGPGTVSEDGSVIRSNAGFGVVKGGWHCGGPSRPFGGAEPSSVTIAAGKNQIVCVNEEVTVTAIGSPTPGTMTWSGGEIPPEATFASGPTSGPYTATFKTKFTTPGLKTITATWSCESREMDADTANISVVDVRIDQIDAYFAPSVERLNITYTIDPPSASVPYAKLEVFKEGDMTHPVFTDKSIARLGATIDYHQLGITGWDGMANVGPDTGKYIRPCTYTVTITLAGNAAFSNGCSDTTITNVNVESITLSVGSPISTPLTIPVLISMNDPLYRVPIQALVKLMQKNGSGVITAVPVDVNWTFTDPGDPNTTLADSYNSLGKNGDPNALYWEGFPGFSSRSNDGYKFTCSSETLTAGAEKGHTKVYFDPSAVGGDDFKLKGEVKCGARTLIDQSGVLIVVRTIEYDKVIEMQGVTHVSRNATKALIQPIFADTFVEYERGFVNAIPNHLSVKYIGLYQDALKPQQNWEEIQMQQAIPRTLKFGPHVGKMVTTEIPTLQEELDAEYAGADPTLVAKRDAARVEITKKAQAWAERIDDMNSAGQHAWLTDAHIPPLYMVGIQYFHPKYSIVQGDSITQEWPNWVEVVTYFGNYNNIDPDGMFALRGLSFGAVTDPTTGTIRVPSGYSDAYYRQYAIPHEIGHATKYAFEPGGRQAFGPALDHSDTAGLMDPTTSLPYFTDREKKILRGVYQP